ncbi:MAG: oligosaccharide flippase family protein [Ignavibacterium sp.]|nr:oligosaccharide flippase family protein [Ignavibacterium sp.]MDW8374248.1 oligosaccharide flippase family protein [Ignavibacteriales bacterium]
MFEKIKELSKDTLIYGISTIVGRLLNFLFVPFFTNVFAPNEYGYIFIIYSYIAIFNIVYIYGLDSAFLKYAAFKDAADDKDNFSTPYISVFITSVILSLMIILFSRDICSFIEVPHNYSNLIVMASLILFFDSNANIPFLKLRLQRKAKLFSFLKVLNIFINLLANFVLIFYLDYGIESILISNLIAAALTLVFLIPTIVKNFRMKINYILLKKLLKFGLPYLPAGLALMFVQVIDVPILERLTDVDTVGIYKANYKLGIFMMLFVGMFQYAWQPFFLNNSREENIKEVFSKVLTYFCFVSSILLILVSLFIEDVIRISFWGYHLIGEKYWAGIPIIPIILLGYLFNGMYVVFSAGIYIKEKSIYAPIVAGIGAAVNIIANFILIPNLNIIGAALATLMSYFIMALGYYIVTQKYYKIEYEYSKIGKIFLSIGIIAMIYYGYLVELENAFALKVIIFILFLVYLFVVVLDKKELDFIKKRILSLI